MQKNYGFRPENVRLDSDHYHLGAARSLPAVEVNPSRDWTAYAPSFEAQAPGFETDGCTVFGTLHCLAALETHMTGRRPNYAERFTYVNAGVSPDGGGDPHAVAESVRTQGVVPQEMLPMTATLDEFPTPNPMTEQYLSAGREWLTERAFGHEWVFTGGQSRAARTALMRQALAYSPLGVSVSAWQIGPAGTYVDAGLPNNHWVSVFREAEDGWLAFDSYEKAWKTIDFDHNIGFCKRYSLRAAAPAVPPARGGCLLSRLFSR